MIPIQTQPTVAGRQRPETKDVVWEEIGFAEFPVVTTSLKRPPFNVLEFTDRIGIDSSGEPLYRTWQMVGSEEYGLPRLPDLDVFIGILKMLETYKYERRLIECNAKEICDIAGITRGGQTYERIRGAFVRFQTTSYVARNHFIDPVSGNRVVSEGWSILTDHRLAAEPTNHGPIDGMPASFFAVSSTFLSRLSHGQPKPIDLALWRQLPLGLEKPIFHYLDKNLHQKPRHEVGLRKLSQRIGLTGNYDTAQLKRLCGRALTTLSEKGFLRSFTFERSKMPADPWKLVATPGPRAFSARAPRVQASTHQAAGPSAPEANVARNSGHPESARGRSDAEELVKLFQETFYQGAGGPISHRELKIASAFLSRCGDLETAKASVKWARDNARWIESIGGLLSDSLPERARAALEKGRMNREEARKRLKRLELQDSYNEWCRRQVDARLAVLSPEERERLIGEASAQQSAGRSGITFSQFPAATQRLLSEGRVRRSLGKDLPSLDEWIRDNPDRSLTESAA